MSSQKLNMLIWLTRVKEMKLANFSSFLKWLLYLAPKRELVSLNERKTLTGINVELNISLIGNCSVQNDCFFTNELYLRNSWGKFKPRRLRFLAGKWRHTNDVKILVSPDDWLIARFQKDMMRRIQIWKIIEKALSVQKIRQSEFWISHHFVTIFRTLATFKMQYLLNR